MDKNGRLSIEFANGIIVTAYFTRRNAGEYSKGSETPPAHSTRYQRKMEERT